MILETERLTLRPLEASDAALLYPLMSDPVAMAYWENREVEDPDVVQALIDERLEDQAAGRGLAWSARVSDGEAFLGFCELTDIDRRRRGAEIAVLIGRAAWGQGYGGEAARAVLGQAAALRIRSLLARIQIGDLKTQRLLEKLGFEESGYLRGQIDRDGERRDFRLWTLEL